MATGYEVKMYRDIERIANALERIADALSPPGDPEWDARLARLDERSAELDTKLARLTETLSPTDRREEQTWWTTADVADYLGVHPGTISSYRARDQMPKPDRRIGRSWVWAPATIKAWRPGENEPSRHVEDLRMALARLAPEHQ